MVGNACLSVSNCPATFRTSILSAAVPCNASKASSFRRLGMLKNARCLRVMCTSEEQGRPAQSPEEDKNLFVRVLEVPRTLWWQTLKPLSDFGFGRRSVWEGGVGLFLVSGAVLFALSLVWLKGWQLRSRFRKYLAVFEFDQASGICTGTPVRIRGVTIGSVIRVNPSLRNIEAVVEVEDDKVIIPRNSLVEVNQSGLLMETLIDVTPRNPIPSPSVGPLDAECVKEGLIVCDRQRIKGYQGISLDALVGVFTRLGREMEEIGVSNSYSLAERVAVVIEEARPLLTKNISSDILGFTGDEATRRNLKVLIKSLSRLL